MRGFRTAASLVLVAPIVVALAVTLTASRSAAVDGAELPALKSISSRLDGAVSTVLIEASEPVAYLTSQPDPDKAPQRFVRFDANKDGELSSEEFVKMGVVSIDR